MKRQVKVVIGANFGDEGKGVMTDYFVSEALKEGRSPLVIRFNGGAQAAHTVVTPEGIEHVFSHFGAGTLQNAPTYLSQFFISNPILFYQERETLITKLNEKLPLVFVHPESLVTTPVDMWINQAIELERGNSRHGSCGLGISETVVRNEHTDTNYHLRVNDLLNLNNLTGKLSAIFTEYLPFRLEQLGYPHLYAKFKELNVDGITSRFLEDISYFLSNVTISTDNDIFGSYDSLVFEGAQGLLLDQDLEEFAPHITHTSTGIKNVLSIIHASEHLSSLRDINLGESDTAKASQIDMEVCYVTRSYLTRHGAGRMDTELATKPYPRIEDPTNIPNEWQGSLRFGHLDLTQLEAYITKDILSGFDYDFRTSLAVTCMDQLEDTCFAVKTGVLESYTKETLLRRIASVTWIPRSGFYTSWGRTRNTIKKGTDLL